ncbi:protein LURP-one-related 15-like [Impatiens glandulifera]|uniref:protein LURP-one-related 15-like n=1 Tax=Impatiens glandulifera TaxID=253017 RepID=UPI001FB16E71|nr:protein LURP-one-related 15-like [Impatiens glandulifera]
MAEPILVVGPEYCISDHPMELGIVRKALALTTGNFKISDVNDNDLFKLQVQWSLHDSRILRDTAGNPIITLREKIRTMHSRWQVFKGNSHDKNDLLFTAVTSSCLQFKVKLNVFLAKNVKEEEPDFKLKGSFSKGSCIIYTGHDKSKTIIAQMQEKTTVQGVLLGKTNFRVTVNPNVDYVLVIALIIILDKIDTFVKKVVDTTVETVTSTLVSL